MMIDEVFAGPLHVFSIRRHCSYFFGYCLSNWYSERGIFPVPLAVTPKNNCLISNHYKTFYIGPSVKLTTVLIGLETMYNENRGKKIDNRPCGKLFFNHVSGQ